MITFGFILRSVLGFKTRRKGSYTFLCLMCCSDSQNIMWFLFLGLILRLVFKVMPGASACRSPQVPWDERNRKRQGSGSLQCGDHSMGGRYCLTPLILSLSLTVLELYRQSSTLVVLHIGGFWEVLLHIGKSSTLVEVLLLLAGRFRRIPGGF